MGSPFIWPNRVIHHPISSHTAQYINHGVQSSVRDGSPSPWSNPPGSDQTPVIRFHLYHSISIFRWSLSHSLLIIPTDDHITSHDPLSLLFILFIFPTQHHSLLFSLILSLSSFVCHLRRAMHGLCVVPAINDFLYIVVAHCLYFLRLCQLRNTLKSTVALTPRHLAAPFSELTPTSPLVPSCINNSFPSIPTQLGVKVTAEMGVKDEIKIEKYMRDWPAEMGVKDKEVKPISAEM